MVYGVAKGIQREGMTRSEEGAINSSDNFKVSRIEGRGSMHIFSFYCLVLIFTVFFSYALLISYLRMHYQPGDPNYCGNCGDPNY